MTEARKNKGGAPKGNWNRLEHGFYSERLRTLKVEAAREVETNVNEEVWLLRALLRRFVELNENARATKKVGYVLDMAGEAAVRIATLLRTNFVLNGRVNDEGMKWEIERLMGKFHETGYIE